MEKDFLSVIFKCIDDRNFAPDAEYELKSFVGSFLVHIIQNYRIYNMGFNEANADFAKYMDQTSSRSPESLTAESFENLINGIIERHHNNDISKDKPKHQNIPVSVNEKTLLGQLKREKESWPLKIQAAVVAGIIAGQSSGKITKPMIREGWDAHGLQLKELPDRLVDEVFKALPVDKQKSAGRPKKGTG